MRRTTFALAAATLFGVPLAGALTGAVALFGAPLPARAEQNMEKREHDRAGHDDAHTGCACGHQHASSPSAGPTARSAAPARTVELAVTGDGFVPAQVRVRKGEPLRLAITRKVERTCATEIVVKDYGIEQPLPLGKTVYVEFTPARSGSVRYACGMDMIGGVLIVE